MRTLHLTTEFPPVIYGGLGTAVGGLVKASAMAGLGVGVLLVGSESGAGYGRLVPLRAGAGSTRTRPAAGARIFEVSWSDGIDAIVKRAMRWRPDVLHLHTFWLWPLAQALRDRLGKPLVYTVHSLDRAEYELGVGPPECLTQWVDQEAVIYGADRVIALTQHERELLKQYCSSVDERVRVVGNGIEDVPMCDSTKCLDKVPPTVLFTGRFVERKGIRELMEAIGIVLAQEPSVRFILAGGHRKCSGAEMEAWLLPASLTRHRTQIEFTGWLTQNQMAKCYQRANILVVPSWYEPFGMVILEGMLHGLAVAASAVGGPNEILENERTGVLFAPRNSEALAKAILFLASDRDRCNRIGAAGAKEVRQKWLWSRIVPKMQSVYAEVAQNCLNSLD
jgi:glycogen(starch) synthase